MCKLIMHMYLISWLFVYLLYIITCVLFELLFVVAYFGWEAQGFSMQDLFRNIVFMNYSLHPKIIVRLGFEGET